MLQWTDHGGGKRDEGTGMDLRIPGGCCSGQTMVEEREMKEQGWTWGFLEGVAVEGVAGDRPWWRDEGTGMDLRIPGGCCRRQTMVEEREMKEQGWT